LKDRAYEGLFLIDSGRAAGDMKAAVGEIEEIIKRIGAEILVCRKWDERRLAYEIAGHRKGTYVVSYFRAPGDQIGEIERRCRLSSSVLRTLILQVPERHLADLMARTEAPRAVDVYDRRPDGPSGRSRPRPESETSGRATAAAVPVATGEPAAAAPTGDATPAVPDTTPAVPDTTPAVPDTTPAVPDTTPDASPASGTPASGPTPEAPAAPTGP